jgi:uncharacterized protein
MSEAALVDADLWTRPVSLATLAPYLTEDWRKYLRLSADGSFTAPQVPFRELHRGMYWAAGEALDGADGPGTLAAELDRLDVSSAVLNSGGAAAVTALSSPLVAAEIARAANEWLRSEWLDADPRFFGSILVTPDDATAAAREIHRLAEVPQMVQVLFMYPPRLLGDRRLHPLYGAAAEHGLPVCLSAGGAHAGKRRSLTPVGFPTSSFEHELQLASFVQPHLASIVCEGVFERFPELRLVLSGFGAAWLPGFLWQFDEQYRRRRLQAPAGVRRAPSDYIRDRVSVTTDIESVPADSASLELLDAVGAARILLFGSGYIRSGNRIPTDVLPEEWRAPVLAANASSLYGLGSR